MKKSTIIYRVIQNVSLMYMFFYCMGFSNAQVLNTFEQRTSTKAPVPYTGKTIYNLRGDFEMFGNTNLVKIPYDNTSANNGTNMAFVDIDGDNTTANSSAAYLNIPNDPCTKVVYAGLYWSGRAQQTVNPNQYTFNSTYSILNNTNADTNVSHNTNNLSYSLTISRGGVNNYDRYPIYTLTLNNTKSIEIHFTNDNTNNNTQRVYYYEDGSATPVYPPGSYSNGVFDINPDLQFTVNGRNYTIKSLNRGTSTTGSLNYYTGSSNISINAPTLTTASKNFDKRKVKIKKEGGVYEEVTAANSDIWFPNNTNTNPNNTSATHSSNQDFIYAAYVDVTDKVKSGGRYYIADMALSEGVSNIPGYSGGWGMIVIYENPSKPWRDITVFDGFAYVIHSSNDLYEIELEGFRSAQRGEINVDMGFLAAEGEIDYTGDFFRMQRADLTTTTAPNNSTINDSSPMNNILSSAHNVSMLNYPYITTTGTTRSNTNFFNSSISNGYGQHITLPNSSVVESRTPFYQNNFGFDLAKIKLDNTDMKFIKNDQTKTKFYYGSNGDTYVIYNVVFAVDAYVPAVEGLNQVLTTQTTADINNLQPGDEVTYTLDIYNYGSDVINNAKIDIDVPFAMKLVDYNMDLFTQMQSGANAAYTFSNPEWINPSTGVGTTIKPATSEGGLLRWTLGTIPTQATVTNFADRHPMATLTYTLKVTDNCLLLQTSKDDCAVEPTINGTITGQPANSGGTFTTQFIKGYNTDCNNTPILGGIDMKINPSDTFLTSCSLNNPIQGETRVFKKFCQATNNVILRSEITAAYITGTKFYSNLPSDPSPVEVTGDFPVNPNGTPTMYYAVLPGTNQACFYQLVTQLEIITAVPTVSNVKICEGEELELENEASQGYSLYYFENENDANALPAAPNPTQPGTYTYWVANGVVQGSGTAAQYCYGDKVAFTITINALPTAATVSDVTLCTYADYTSTITTGGNTIAWEYLDGTNWVTLGTQLPGVSLVGDQLKVTKAPSALNGKVFRVKSTNSNNCTSYSQSMNLTVKGCKMPVNPMIHTPLNR